MVSTRLMSSCSNSTGDFTSCAGPSSAPHVYPPDLGPAKCTRNSVTSMANALKAPVQCYRPQNAPVPVVRFLDLPDEVIEKILGYLSFKEMCKLRLVCRRIDQISAYILNSTFSKLQNQMLQRFQEIKSKMPRRESARRSHHLACESDIVETLHMRLTLLQMSFGKHIERKHCCFFPGEILDEVYSILHYIRTTPRLDLPYKVTDELFDLSTMAMEYFKEKIEPNLPEIAYFSSDFINFSSSFASPTSSKYCLEASTMSSTSSKVDHTDPDVLEEEFVEIPQSNMVLRKRIRKIKQGMKRYNNQLTVLRQELKICKKKTADQQKQIIDQQKQLADQQKQTLEYATRLDEYDKKNEEISRKFSTLLQELNKCKTELQYWRCKSPARPPVCNNCGNPVAPEPEEIHALVNQGVNPQELGLEAISEEVDHGVADVEQGSNSNAKDGELSPIKPAKLPKECEEVGAETLPEKMVEMGTSSPRPSKRKSSSEEREDAHQAKKTRRSGKTRCKRSGSKV